MGKFHRITYAKCMHLLTLSNIRLDCPGVTLVNTIILTCVISHYTPVGANEINYMAEMCARRDYLLYYRSYSGYVFFLTCLWYLISSPFKCLWYLISSPFTYSSSKLRTEGIYHIVKVYVKAKANGRFSDMVGLPSPPPPLFLIEVMRPYQV